MPWHLKKGMCATPLIVIPKWFEDMYRKNGLSWVVPVLHCVATSAATNFI